MRHDEMPSIAAERALAGTDVLPLRGTIAAPLPPHVREAVREATVDEHAVTPPSRGHLELREAIARSLPAPADPERGILVTNGAMHALSLTFRALLEPGDEVIVPTPCYFFGGLIERAGGTFVPVPSWDPAAIEGAVTTRTRALVVTNPNNPDGRLPSRQEIDELLIVASRQQLTVITDEAYERCIHEGELASAWGAENVILIRSLGKSLAMPAWRLGFVAGEPSLIDACLRELEWDVIRVGHAAQRAATAALEGPQDWLDEVAAAYRADRDAAHAVIADDAILSAPLPAATPFLFVDLGGLASRTCSPRVSRSSTARPSAHPATPDCRSAAPPPRRRAPPPAPARDVVNRIGVDIGGTFTDVVLLGADGTLRTKKVLSTPDDYARGVVQGILELLEDTGAEPASVTKVVHATTVASNAVLEGKGPRCALLTTAGFRDVLELRRLRIPVMYDLQYEKPPPLVPRRRRFEIPERIGPRGEVWLELDEDAVRDAAERARAEGVEAIAISFLHAYANPAHERRAAELVREVVGPDVYITCSSEILAEIREYERTSTAVVNAYVGPVVAALPPLARVAPGRGRHLGAAPDHAVERRRHGRRGRDPEAGAPRRVRAGRRRRRLRLPRARRPGSPT